MSSEPAATRIFSQWPAPVAATSVYAVAIAVVAGRLLAGSGMPIGQKVAIAIFLVFLLASEALALVLANGAIEAVGRRLGRHVRWLDPLKAIALTALVVLPAASLVKFQTIGIHLKSSDFWFVLNSAAQLAQESLAAEKAIAAQLAGASIVLFLGLWFLFAWRRRGGGADGIRPAKLVGLLALTIVGASACHRLYPIIPVFAYRVVPEVHWASQHLAPDPFRPRRAAATTGGTNAGPPIATYPVETASGNRMNVVLIMLESVPWSRTPWSDTPSKRDRSAVMPNLAALTPESVIFERAYTASTHSDYAQMAILSSLYPRKYDVHDYYTLLDYPRTLIWDALRPAGYATSVFSCQNEQWGNMIQYLDTPGLGVLRHSPSWPDARHKGSGVESKVYEETPVSEWRRWRERGREPYFTYLNFQSNHFSYEIPPEAERPFAPHELDFAASFVQYPKEKVPVMSNRFDNALHYADRWIGEVVRTLQDRGEWDRTILIVVSDHGEAFYEHAQPTHGTSLYEEQVRSLWLMRVPGLPGRRIESPVSLLDLAPALLEALDLPPHGNFQGRADVLSPDYDGTQRALPFTIQGLTQEDGVLHGDWKLTLNWDRRARSLYNLAEDPAELENLATRFPGQADRLQAMATGLIERQLAYYAERRWEEGYYPPAVE